MISDKYIAGLVDSDGNIGVKYLKIASNKDSDGVFAVYTQFRISEAVGIYNTLPLVQEAIEGEIYVDKPKRIGPSKTDTVMQHLHFQGKKAVSILNRLKPYIYTKRGLVELVDAFNATSVKREEFAAKIKSIRATGQVYPNYLPRKYMCGYIDGNGSLTGRLVSSGLYYPMLTCSAWEKDVGLLELMKKQFGGSICAPKASGAKAVKWDCFLTDPSKCVEVLEHLSYLVRLKPQRDFLLSWVRTEGNFRKGEQVRTQLMTLNKARLQRPNSRTSDKGEAMVQTPNGV